MLHFDGAPSKTNAAEKLNNHNKTSTQTMSYLKRVKSRLIYQENESLFMGAKTAINNVADRSIASWFSLGISDASSD